MSNITQDLIWELTKSNNAFMVKRRSGGGVTLSRDPMNVFNLHSRKYSSLGHDKAVGIQPGDKGSVVFTSKTTKNSNKPGKGTHTVSWGGGQPTKKSYRGIAINTAKNEYRPELRGGAVARASAIRKSQRPVKESPEKKPRGSKAKLAAGSK